MTKIGPHKRAGIRRRRGKAIVLVVTATMLALNVSVIRVKREPAKPELTKSAKAYMLNVMKYSPGLAEIYLEEYPELADEYQPE